MTDSAGKGRVAGVGRRRRRHAAPCVIACPASGLVPRAHQIFQFRVHVLDDRITYPLAGCIFQLEDEQ
ncbi:MAG: hypothetical protein ABSB01_07320 [Streptosporangiaceae bacterium]